MPCGLELGEVLGHVAAGEDAAVHGGVERDDAVAEQLPEAGELLERGHRDPLVGERLRGAAARDQLDAELGELPRERGEAGLVVDGEERPLNAHGQPSDGRSRGDQLPHDLGEQSVLDGLDPRPQGLGRVARHDRDGLAPDHGPGVDALVDPVDGGAGLRARRPRARPRSGGRRGTPGAGRRAC